MGGKLKISPYLFNNQYDSNNLRDWSLITGRGGGATKREGGHVKFYPYEKGGRKSFSHAEGGAQKVLG